MTNIVISTVFFYCLLSPLLPFYHLCISCLCDLIIAHTFFCKHFFGWLSQYSLYKCLKLFYNISLYFYLKMGYYHFFLLNLLCCCYCLFTCVQKNYTLILSTPTFLCLIKLIARKKIFLQRCLIMYKLSNQN